jgi:hypothetical protein
MYVCKVSNKDMTVEIPSILLVTDSVPLFTQKPLSYLALPTLTDAHLHFSIELSFKPTDYNGKWLGWNGYSMLLEWRLIPVFFFPDLLGVGGRGNDQLMRARRDKVHLHARDNSGFVTKISHCHVKQGRPA